MYKFLCKNCGKEYENIDKRSRYCSRDCYEIFRSKNKIKEKVKYSLICLNCDKEYFGLNKKGKFCSASCNSIYKMSHNLKKSTCKNCGNSYEKIHSRHYFCCSKCKEEYHKDGGTKILVECSFCANKVERLLSDVKRKGNKNFFCNRKCESNYRVEKSRDERFCETCGDIFICKKSDKLRFCSIKCQSIWQSEYLVGEKSATYKKDIPIEKRRKNCEYCGKEFFDSPKQIENKKFCSYSCKAKSMPKTMSKPHISVIEILKNNKFDFEIEKQFQRYSIDCFVNPNLFIEVMGGYWHCDNRFYLEPMDKMQERSIARDKKKKQRILNSGYKVLYLWEDDISKNIKTCEKLIIEFIKKNGNLSNYHSMNYSIKNRRLYLSKEILIPFFEK